MYIRRKVFSVVEDQFGQERLFSTNEIMDEADYLEAMFSNKDSKAEKYLPAAALGTVGAGAGIYGVNKLKGIADTNALARTNMKQALKNADSKLIKDGAEIYAKYRNNPKKLQKELEALQKADRTSRERLAKDVKNAKKSMMKTMAKLDNAGKWLAKNPGKAKLAAAGAAGLGLAGLGYAASRD